MSTLKSQILAGSRGSQVEELQKALNNHGYGLSVDGIFGSATEAAVRDFQKKQGLSVDGIVGTNTWGKLFPTTTSSGSSVKTETGSTNPVFKPSAETESAKAAYDGLVKPEGVDPSYWQSVQDAYNKIMNREDFSYDLNGDALYQQYKDRYIQQGKMAMQDTMGQAAALTGGYGSSYASTAGNQAYQGYLQGLNDVIPELQQMAYERYAQEGQDLLNKYSMAMDAYGTKYGEYADAMNQYNADRQDLYGIYSALYDRDYGQYRDSISDTRYAEEFAYQQERDKVADEQWERQFEAVYGKKDDTPVEEKPVTVPEYYKDETGKTVYGSYNNRGYSDDIVKAAQEYVGATADGKWGSDSAQKAKDKGFSGLQAVVEAMGGEEKAQYAGWDAGDWEAYFAYIRQTDGHGAAMEEFDRMSKAGFIPKNMAAYAAIGVRGGNTGH